MIEILRGNLTEIDEREALRYLGYGRQNIPETEVKNLLADCKKEVLEVQDLRACYSVFDISVDGDNLDLGFVKVKSHSLSINLSGCDKAVVFACTAGVGIDRLIARYSRISPARAAVVQALGAALVEGWCEEICGKIKERFGETKPRFSCGYGDLPLTLQHDIFAALSVTKHTGITLSDDCFMTPTKSVTAIVGIKENL